MNSELLFSFLDVLYTVQGDMVPMATKRLLPAECLAYYHRLDP